MGQAEADEDDEKGDAEGRDVSGGASEGLEEDREARYELNVWTGKGQQATSSQQ